MMMLSHTASRRATLRSLVGAIGLAAAFEGVEGVANAADGVGTLGSTALSALSTRLASAPRRRTFSSVPFMVDRPELWDHEASAELLAYSGGPRQVWENTEIAAPWLNLMREAVNGQVFAHRHPDFLAVAAMHGNAHLSLFNQAMWNEYGLAGLTGDKFARNDLIVEKAGVSPADDRQNIAGFYGPQNNNIVSLQRRGMVFVACHDSVHAIARGLATKLGPQKGTADVIAADLTNNLLSGVVLVPSVVAYLVELQHAGFTYAKGA